MGNGFELAGKHRGIVVDNVDPLKLGRLKVRVQAAYGEQPVDNLPWAWPCFAYGGMPQMALFAVPEIGAGVWVEFQWKDGQPDATYPVWTGMWLAQGETPPEVKGGPEDAHWYKVFKTTSGHYMTFCDKPGEEYIRIEDKHGDYVSLKDGNIYIGTPGTVYTNGNMTATSHNGCGMSVDEDIRLESERNILTKAKGDAQTEVGGSSQTKVSGDAQSEIGGSYQTKVSGDAQSEIGGTSRSTVVGDLETKVSGSSHVEISGDSQSDVTGNASTKVAGESVFESESLAFKGGKETRIESEAKVTLQAAQGDAESGITVEALNPAAETENKITIKAEKLVVEADEIEGLE